MNERLARYATLDNVIFDRHPIVSQAIYGLPHRRRHGARHYGDRRHLEDRQVDARAILQQTLRVPRRLKITGRPTLSSESREGLRPRTFPRTLRAMRCRRETQDDDDDDDEDEEDEEDEDEEPAQRTRRRRI